MSERMYPDVNPEQSATRIQLTLNQPFPQQLGRDIVRRYQSVFCTELRVPGGHGGRRSSVYIARDSKGPPTIVLYRLERDRIMVANEYFSIEADEVASMARHLFDTHAEANIVALEAVSVGPGCLPHLHQRFNATEDIVIPLPATEEAYTAALGRNTRAAIRRCHRLLSERTVPIEFSFHDKDAAGRGRIAELVELSRLRITGKKQVPTHTDRSVAELQRMVDAYGVTLIARAEGRVCGGVVCTHVGSHFYMHVLAHDRTFDDLRLGLLCCYLSIGEAIRRGAVEYHLLSGKYDYKFRLLGEQRDFDRLVIYRSLGSLALNFPVYVRTLVRGQGRALKRRLKTWRGTWKN